MWWKMDRKSDLKEKRILADALDDREDVRLERQLGVAVELARLGSAWCHVGPA